MQAMSDSWPNTAVGITEGILTPIANPAQAQQMASYMKHVAPFLGVRAPERRRVLHAGWHVLAPPTSDELGRACLLLMDEREREYHYAANDLIGSFLESADERFLVEYVEDLLTTKSWWDTVDGLGTAAVSPLCWLYDATDLILKWSRSDNMWLNRAAIQHQRGWKQDTDIGFVLAICASHAASREFFVAKAIGWALRDIARLDPHAVAGFLDRHPGLSAVAVREARRGLRS
jgi:3-methyladenine DNA glycosylase AlkD